MTAQADAECCTAAPAQPSLQAEAAADLAVRFKALGDPNRLTLLSLIAASEGGEACVCDLTEPVGLGQPTVSHHLKILVDAGFLTRERRGSWTYYATVPGALRGLCEDLCADTALNGMLDGAGSEGASAEGAAAEVGSAQRGSSCC